MKIKKVLRLVIFFSILMVMNLLVFAVDSEKQASNFQSNGDLIDGWYWLRDSALQNYAEWTFDNIPLGPDEITVQINALATDRPSGGGGFDAKFLLYYSLRGEGDIPETLILPQTVTLKNVLSPDDPLGYSCQGQVTIPASTIPAASRISLRIRRDSAQDNHVAFKEDSIVLLTDVTPPSNGDHSPNDDDFEGAIPIQPGTYTGSLGEENEEALRDNDDYYKIDLEDGQLITLQLTIPGNAQYGILLLNPNHNSRGSSITQREIKTLDYVADSTGTWYIKISRSSGEGEYQLAMNTSIENDGEPGNNPPVISSLDASQNPVEVNQTVTITCSASDQDIETFTFRWSVNGEIIEEESSSLSWIAPDTAGTYNITCVVSDGRGGEDSESVSITVTDDSGGANSSCSYSFSSYDTHFSSSGGNGEFTITSSISDCQWTAVSDVSWIQIDSGGSGPGSQTLHFSVQNNGSNEERTGHINIENEIYTITQELEPILTIPQPNGESIPFLNSCRGACGSGCPDTAKSLPDITIRVADPLNDMSHYLLTYTEVTECGTHAACRWHDACFDQCKLCGEDSDVGPLHDLCSAAVVDRYGPVDGGSWALGNGPYDGYFIFANEELDQQGPFPGSVHSPAEANYRIDIDTAFFPGAGTDANVYITLFGTDGSSSAETLLDNSGMNDFEMGMHDTFNVSLKNFEEINRIRLRHDNSFPISGSITLDDIISSNISLADFIPGSISLNDIIPGNITLDDISPGSISLDDLIPGNISLDDFIPGSITIDDLIPGNISLDDIIPGRFSLDDIIPDSISSIGSFLLSSISSLADINLGDFSLNDLTPGSISLNDFVPGSISIDDIIPSRISFNDIAPGAITLDDLIPGSITIDDLIPGSFSLDDIIPGNFLAGWYVNEVRVINQDTGQLWHFITNRWLAEDEGDGRIDVEFPLSYKDERDYQIEVYTGDLDWKIGEGTDANIYITLFGSNGFNTGEIFLNYPMQNNFETGAHDTFYYIRTGNVGELNHITLSSDNSGIGSDWYCEKIEVKEVKQGAYGEWYIPGTPIPSNWESDTERVWVTPVNNWLTEDNSTRTCYPQ